jgi:uncharacterized protein (TIGR00251 family)
MRFSLKVVPGARRNEWIEENGGFKVFLTAPAVDGKANDALVKFLTGHFKVKPSQIQIIKGLKSRHKIINIEGI